MTIIHLPYMVVTGVMSLNSCTPLAQGLEEHLAHKRNILCVNAQKRSLESLQGLLWKVGGGDVKLFFTPYIISYHIILLL
jgi:hypothetical protein